MLTENNKKKFTVVANKNGGSTGLTDFGLYQIKKNYLPKNANT